MQTEPGRYRYRGWRESRRLVELAKSVPCDLARVWTQHQANSDYYDDNIVAALLTLVQTRVSQIQHLRCQIRYRLRNHS